MSFRRCEGRCVHGDGNDKNAIFSSLVDFETIEQRKEFHVDDVFDVLGLQETVIGIVPGL